jgi:predicted ribosomally synthesized peptide with SipW-like signal peptide
MKNIFLSVVVICALAIAGIGGTLAGFNDTEKSLDNKVEMGSIDLKVNNTDDEPWGEGISGTIVLERLNPGEVYQTNISVRNAGDKESYLYIKFKNEHCYNIVTHEEWWYEEPITGKLKPEPELVAEWGGVVDSVWVDGWGVSGDNCSMGSSVRVAIDFDGEWIIGTPKCPVMIGSLEDVFLPLGVLEECGVEHFVSFWVYVPQVIDEDWPYPEGEPDELAYWPTNRIMADGIEFEIEFLVFDRALGDMEVNGD